MYVVSISLAHYYEKRLCQQYELPAGHTILRVHSQTNQMTVVFGLGARLHVHMHIKIRKWCPHICSKVIRLLLKYCTIYSRTIPT